MGDWRAMGQGMRRRSGRPSSHLAGARNPSQLPRFVNDPSSEPREAGRPHGTTKELSFWDQARRQESASEAKLGESVWAKAPLDPEKQRKLRMKPEGQYFG